MKSYLLIDSLRRRQCVNIVSTEPISSVDLFGQKIKLLDVGQFEMMLSLQKTLFYDRVNNMYKKTSKFVDVAFDNLWQHPLAKLNQI